MTDSSKKQKTYFLQIGLFILTIFTTTLAGIEWISAKRVVFGEEFIEINDFYAGLSFSIPFIAILTIHEFGHYLTAKYYHVKVTLPFYLPLWLGFIGFPSIGTAGAFIKLKSPVDSRKGYFDIGVAGPLAGFVAALGVLWYGFTHLPPPEYIFEIHPKYAAYGLDYAQYVYKGEEVFFSVGDNLLFLIFEKLLVDDPTRIPNQYELIHYPWLWAGYLALFFTALNLLPIGQLDGGHVLYGLFGRKKHAIISRTIFILFVFYAGLGILNPFTQGIYELLLYMLLYVGFLYTVFMGMKWEKRRDTLLLAVSVMALQFVVIYLNPQIEGFYGWLLYAFLVGRVLGLDHPPALYDEPLDLKRQVVGWIALLVFILSFSPKPFIVG